MSCARLDENMARPGIRSNLNVHSKLDDVDVHNRRHDARVIMDLATIRRYVATLWRYVAPLWRYVATPLWRYVATPLCRYKVQITVIIVLACLVINRIYPPPIRDPSKANVREEKKTENDSKESARKSIADRLKIGFDDLGREFPTQSSRLWDVTRAGILPIVYEDRPKSPAVVLLAAPKGAAPTLDCVVRRTATMVRESFSASADIAEFDCRPHRDAAPEEVKRKLNEELTQAFQNGAKVGVILGVEALPGKSPMIFYRLADTANAPFKDVIILITLELRGKEILESVDEVYDELTRLWKSRLDPDQLEPLFSRIANSVVFVRNETRLESIDCYHKTKRDFVIDDF